MYYKIGTTGIFKGDKIHIKIGSKGQGKMYWIEKLMKD